MKRSPLITTLALVGAFLALVVIVLFARSDDPTPQITMGADVGEVQPTAENVDPTFHARIMSLRAEVEASPRDTLKLLGLAHLHQDAHQMAEAAELYERVLIIVPEHRQTHLDLALCYSVLGQWEDARSTMEKLLAVLPNDPSALYNLGAIHANQGRTEEARTLWRQVQTQTEDVHLASQATASLAQLETMGSSPLSQAGGIPAGPNPAPPAAGPPPVPLNNYEPVIAGQ